MISAGAEGDHLRWRRQLARELTQRARARDTGNAPRSFGGTTRRIGISGPPGAGKSSLIAMIAREYLGSSRKVGILAIDPTSPVSGGSLLGDRIRMSEVAADPNLFIRSIASGSAFDGLCPNISSLLSAFEEASFEYLLLETVGVGQVSYEARLLVDTFVLVLVPGSGDTIQAMKAGILEVADIYAVNKADQQASLKLATELRAVARRRAKTGSWIPPVVLTSCAENRGAAALVDAIAAHREATLDPERVGMLTRARRDYYLRSMILQLVNEALDCRTDHQSMSTADTMHFIIDRIRREAP